MSEQNISQSTTRDPYGKKLKVWEDEVVVIKKFIEELPEINLLSLPIRLLKEKLISASSKKDSKKDEILEKREKLEKIKAGIRKMTETLSQTMSDDLDNPNLDKNLKRIVDLRLKVNQLLNELADKDPEKSLESFNDQE